MNSDDLHEAYQREARLANTIGLSVPVSIAVQQLLELRKISSLLEKLIEISSRPPMIVEPAKIDLPASSKPPISKKDSRP